MYSSELEKAQLLSGNYSRIQPGAPPFFLPSLKDEYSQRNAFDALEFVDENEDDNSVDPVANVNDAIINVMEHPADQNDADNPIESEMIQLRNLLSVFDEIHESEQDNVERYQSNPGENPRRRQLLANEAVEDPRNVFDDIHDLMEDVNNIPEFCLYPRFGTHGSLGEVHYCRIFLQVHVRGPDGSVQFRDDILGDDDTTSLVVLEHRDYHSRCIHGGQVYSPGSINYNFSRCPKELKEKIGNLTLMLSDYLCGNRPELFYRNVHLLKMPLLTTMTAISDLCELWLEHERTRDNQSVRCELNLVFTEPDGAIPSISLNWPYRRANNLPTPWSDFCHGMFKVNQHVIYQKVKRFREFSVDPIMKTIEMSSEVAYTLSAEAKTFLVWSAECILRETFNSFFVGRIHQFVRDVSHRSGSFQPHVRLRKKLSHKETAQLGVIKGLDPRVCPTVFKKSQKSENQLETLDVLKRAVSRNRGLVDFPELYVNAMKSMWVTIQRFSLNKSRKDEIGFFQCPIWDNLTVMNAAKYEKFILVMSAILTDAYRRHWTAIHKQLSKKWHYEEDRETMKSAKHGPCTVREVMTQFFRVMIITGEQDPMHRLTMNQHLSSNDRLTITRVGTSIF
jgi:hypothetical protein